MELTVGQVAHAYDRSERLVQLALRSGALAGHRTVGRVTTMDDIAARAWSRSLAHGRPWTPEVRDAALDLLSDGHTNRLSASERSRLKARLSALTARDIAHAVACVLAAPRDAVHNEVFNVGDDKQNYQIRTIADIIASAFPGCSLHVGELRGDRRNYRVDFEKINTQLPGFSCRYDVERGAQELYDVFSSIELTREDFQWRGYTRLSQIRWLLDTGQLDADLRWRTAAA